MSNQPQSITRRMKLVLLGDLGVGKSSLALRFVCGEFHENMATTIGAEFLTQTTNVDNYSIKLHIWDMTGNERYHSLAPMYYRGAQAAIVVYDVTSADSYNRALSWIRELRQPANSHIVLVLAGNKADMAGPNRAVLTEDAQAYSADNGLIFAETSAKTGMGVNDIFIKVAHKLASRLDQGGSLEGNRDGVRLKGDEGEKKKCCC